MKKSLTRALSLVLVLVMMLGVMPVASADGTTGSCTISGDTAATISSGTAVVNLTASATAPAGYDQTTAAYEWSGVGVNGSGTSASVTAVSAGTVTVSVTATFNRASDADTTTYPNATATVSDTHVIQIYTALESITVSGGGTIAVGGTTTVSASLTPSTASSSGLTFISSAPTVASVDPATGVVTGLSVGEAQISARIGSIASAQSVTVTVAAYTVSCDDVALKVGESKTLQPSVSPAPAATPVYTYGAPADATIATVSSAGVVKGLKAGTTTVAVSAGTAEDADAYGTTTVDITVTDGPYIACAAQSAAVGSRITLTPVLYRNASDPVTGATFSYTANGCTVSTVDNKSFTITASSAGVASVTFTANAFVGSDGNSYSGEAITLTVPVSFYGTSTLKIGIKDTVSSLKFSDTAVVSSATISASPVANAASYSVGELISLATPLTSTVNTPTHYSFTISSLSGGELVAPTSGALPWTSTNKQVSISNLSTVGFVQKSSTVKTSTMTITALKSLSSTEVVTVGQISLEITMGTANTIKYSTAYNQAISFKAEDFVAYWNANKLGTNSTLTHVYFNVSNLIPAYGELYNSTAKTAAVTASMKFVPSYTTAGTYSLSAATYVPEKSLTSEYSVEIPFTAYGTNSQVLSGYVTVKLNEKSNIIGSRGVTLGDSHSDSIAANYYTSTGQQLGYVVFGIPSAKYGKLYRSIPKSGGYGRVTEASSVLLGDAFYYTATTGQKDLKTVSFVPAAGYDGIVTLTYTAYNAGGAYPYQGSISFDVQTKTASQVFTDVTAKNYSWASDSVDFLYYEGTAQGSNGKYNPAANITRQDFMLMLYRAFLAEDYGTFTPTSNFPDVVKGTTAYSKEIYQAVGVAKYLGIAQGTNNKFNPKSNITRQEAMVLIYRTLDTINKDLEYTTSAKLTSMKDYAKVSSWATTAIANLVSHGVIKGNNDYIKPMDNISRAEMAAILHRVITY